MRFRRSFSAATIAVAALVMLVLASGGAAKSASTTYTVTNSAQLNIALAFAASGDTILIKPGTYYTADAATPTDGYSNVSSNLTITGKTDKKGNCTNTATTILDGDNKPSVGPGHVGPVFTNGGNNTTFKCFTMRYGTAGIVSDTWNGMKVNTMNFVGNGRDLNQNTDNWDGDGIWVQDGHGVVIKKSTFSGMGRSGVESDVNLNSTNDGWIVQQNVLKNIRNSCLDLSNNTTTQVGQLSGSKASNGNSCAVAGTASDRDAITVNDQGFGGTPNIVAGNTVSNAWYRCFYVSGDGAKFYSNVCNASQDYEGAYLNGNGLVANGFTVGQSYNPCITSDGDSQMLSNINCGTTRDNGVVINGNGTKVTNLSVKQSKNTCLDSEGNNQVWTNVSCLHVTGTGGNDYGLYGGGTGSSFTGISIGDVYDDCFYFDNTGQVVKTISCHGSSDSSGIYVNAPGIAVDGFDITSSYSGCAVADSANGDNTTFKNGHCGRVLQSEAVYGYGANFSVDRVVVDAAYGDCFAHYAGTGGTLTNSTGTACGTGDTTDGGIEWNSDGTNTISGNKIKLSSDNSLYVGSAGGDYTIANNTFKNAQNNDCVSIGTPDTLTMTGNTVQGCGGGNIIATVVNNPKVNLNVGLDASGTPSANPAVWVTCTSTCSSGQVNGNVLDGAGDGSTQGLLVTNNGSNGLTISGNTISNMSGTGLEVNGGASSILANNVVKNSSSTDNLFGIFLNSDGNTLTGSTVTGGFDNGVEVAGDNNVVNNNVKINGNGEDGIHIASTADSTSLTGNKTQNNSGEGLEDDGTNTTLTNNISSGNRQDCAGTDATFTAAGNTCSDGSFFTDAGSIDKPVHK